jgi:hypothetical protein
MTNAMIPTHALIPRWIDGDPTLTASQRKRAARAHVKAELFRSGFRLSEPLLTKVKRLTQHGHDTGLVEVGIRCWARRGDGAVLRGVLLYRAKSPGWYRFLREGEQLRGHSGYGWGTVQAAIIRGLGGGR